MPIIYRQSERPGGEPPLPRDDREALAWLDAGNLRFSRAALESPDSSGQRPALVLEGDFGLGAVLGRDPDPRPFGIVLGCADSRVPTELVFGRAVNDLFVIRLAGNTVGDDAMGSLEYAIDHFPSVRVITVLGHTLCGAVAAAVEVFRTPSRYLDLATSEPLRSLIDRILLSVRIGSLALATQHGAAIESVPGYGWALLEVSVFLNAAYVAYCIRQSLTPEERTRVSVAYGVYGVTSLRVSAASGSTFDAPPENAEEFRALARTLAASPRVAELLAGSPAAGTV
jgi:carbonic anhydrase